VTSVDTLRPVGEHDDDRDRCLCGTVVVASWASEPRTAGDRIVERGSCTVCGLQLVRRPGERWSHIRG
jgi:hypothetical protein